MLLARSRIAILSASCPRLIPRRAHSNVELFVGREVSWFRKFGQDDKWNFCLTMAIIAVNRRNHEQTTPAEPLSGLQGEGGSGRRQGRSNHRPTGGAFRRPSQPDNDMEIAA